MALPVNGSTSDSSLLLIYRPRKDERLSWPSWLTFSGRFTHISCHPSAAGRAQDRESSPARDRRSTTATPPPAHPGGPGRRAVKRVCVCVMACYMQWSRTRPAACRTQLFPFPFTPNVTPLRHHPTRFSHRIFMNPTTGSGAGWGVAVGTQAYHCQ